MPLTPEASSEIQGQPGGRPSRPRASRQQAGFFAGLLIADIQMVHGVAAQVERINVPGGVFGAIGIARIVDGGGVTIAGEDRKSLQGGTGREGIGDALAHAGTEAGIGFAAEAQTSLTGERVEKGTAGGGILPFGGNGLEEGTTVGLIVDDAGSAEAQPCVIGEYRTGTGGGTGVHDLSDGREKAEAERENAGVYNYHRLKFS